MVLFPCPFYSHECLYLPQTAKVWRTFAAETSILNSMIFFFIIFILPCVIIKSVCFLFLTNKSKRQSAGLGVKGGKPEENSFLLLDGGDQNLSNSNNNDYEQ